LERQKDVDFYAPETKVVGAVHSVITDVDLTVSKMFREFIANEFDNLDYIILDEETAANLGTDPVAEMNKHEYVFIIDPIDGTLTYASGFPFWGICIGVFKNGRPFAGGAFAPALNLMVYADEDKAYAMENGETKELKPLPDTTETPPLVVLNNAIARKNLNMDLREIQPLQFYSAVMNLIYVAMNRARGYWFGVNLWDIAGFLPIFARIGIQVRGMKNGKEFLPFDSGSYKSDKLIVDQIYVVSRPKYYDWMKNIVNENKKDNI